MNNHTHTQYTSVLHGNPKWEKTTKLFFLYVLKNYIHWKHHLPLFSSCNWKDVVTPLFLKLQLEGSSNSLILWLQPEGGYNPLCSLSTTGRWLQPPVLALSNHPKVEVEFCNHYHTITMRYTALNLYQ
jgi:hypothetical protein